MKMKKLGALLLAGVMTMSTLLTGCGNGASGSSAGGNASQTESGSNGERKKITILMRASETSAKYIIMKKLLTDFSEEKGLEPPEFELISGDADYVTKLQLYINSNTLPDIYGCANGALSAAAKDIGGIVNIGDELERVGKKDDMNAAVYDFFKDKDDGNVYLFPEALNCEFFFYRKDIFEKYNLEAPTTWNEFLDTCKTLKDNGEIPLIVAGKENWQLMRYLSFAPWRMTKDQFIMDYIVKFAEGFMNLFKLGGETFISWMTGIVPVVLMLLVAMNTLIALLGEEKVNKLAQASAKNPVSRYMILPFVSAFILGNPMSISMGRFLPEYYKPGFVAAQMQFCHTSNGVFPHINPGELFVWMGIASGVQALGLNTMDLAIRYLLVGLVMNFVGGWVTDFTTAYVSKQQGITLSKTL